MGKYTAATATATVALGSFGLAVASGVAPAFGASVPGCGESPAGGTLERIGGICQLTFDAAGTYSWTVPSGLAGLYAVVAGAGSGALANGFDVGYAGSGGQVEFVDLTSAPAGSTANIVVGAGGSSDYDTSPTDGGSSSIDAGSLTTATGGVAVYSDFCEIPAPFSAMVAVGAGSQGAGGSHPATTDCSIAFAPGVNPSIHNDSTGDAPFAIFAGYSDTLGAGGRVVISPDILDASIAGTGRGADVFAVDSGVPVPSFHSAGGDGRVVLRYLAIDELAEEELASTGADATTIMAFSGGLIVVGLALFARGRRKMAARSS